MHSSDATVSTEVRHEEDDLPTSILPSFPIGAYKYVILTDIMTIFDLREDYCLALIAQNFEEDDKFLNKEVDTKYLQIDSRSAETEFKAPAETLQMIYQDALHYEATLPTEAKF